MARKHADASIALGAAFDYAPLKLAVDFRRLGLNVRQVFLNTLRQSDLPWLTWLEEHSPEMELYFGSDPEALEFAYCSDGADLTIGLEFSFYRLCPHTRRLAAGEEPFEFLGLRTLLRQIDQTLSQPVTAPAPTAPSPYARSWSMYRKELV